MATVTASPVKASAKPSMSEVDVFGITDPGNVRSNNADHFLLASFHRAIRVHASSMPADDLPTLSPDSRGFLFLVADGVGSLSHAKEGSAKLTDAIARHLVEMSEVSLQSHPDRESEVFERVRVSVALAHNQLRDYAKEVAGSASFDPELTITDIRRGDRWLLCTDGLTRHVSEKEISAAERTTSRFWPRARATSLRDGHRVRRSRARGDRLLPYRARQREDG